MLVSGSILAVSDNYIEYARQLKSSSVDFLHIDIFQDKGDFKLKDLLLFDNSFLPLDVHLIFNDITDEDIDILNSANIDYINIQYETLQNKDIFFSLAGKLNAKLGLAITSRTETSTIDEYIDVIAQVLFMCSEPGISGAKFDRTNLERISEVHNKYPSLFMAADGGIDAALSEIMGQLGISLVVSGSYLCKDFSALSENAYNLKYMNEQNVKIVRNMIRVSKLPIVSANEKFMDVINCMNAYRLGLVFVVENQKLIGIVSDGDIRRKFIEYEESIFGKSASELMNVSPYCADSDCTMMELYKHLSMMFKGIDVVPILDKGRFIGAIDLRIGV